MSSVRTQLLAWLLGGTMLSSVVVGLGVYVEALDEANAVFDSQLRQVAVAFPLQMAAIPDADLGEAVEGGLVIQVWERGGGLIYASGPEPLPPHYEVAGLRTLAALGERWRIYTTQHDGRFVQVAQPVDVRRALAVGIAVRTALPLALLLPLLGVLIWVVVGRGLRPLGRLADALRQRAPESTEPLEAEPGAAELRPVVEAINALLARLQGTMEAQRAFVADAAHELRTPLAALKLQLQLAERSTGTTERGAAFAKVHERLDRANRLVGQLLTLARLEPGTRAGADAPLDLALLVRSVLSDFAAQAQHRNVELAGDTAAVPAVRGDGEALRILLNNLIDNALRHTPPGGQVRVSCAAEPSAVVLRVADTGPGIPSEERQRVFDRFYRRLGSDKSGSGLGLAIVKRIAEDHGAEVHLSDPPKGSGLVVTVRLRGL